MTNGHFPDAYLENQGAAGFRWYFSTLGVHAVASDLKHDDEVRAYLNRYLGTATLPGGAIDDVEDLTETNVKWKPADSDDSYAATILSLASWYSTRPNGTKWFRSKLPQLKFIATANLLNSIDPISHLTFTFNRLDDRFTNPTAAQVLSRKVCYTMNACESYRGLADFAVALRLIQDPDAKKYQLAASIVADGIRNMFDNDRLCFRVANISTANDPINFYPNRIIQVAPQLYGVDLGPNTQLMYDAAWRYMNASGDRWWRGEIAGNSTGGEPFMMLGHVAAMRGDIQKATEQLNYLQNKLTTSPGFARIHELGHALKISGYLHQKSNAKPFPSKQALRTR